MEPARTNADPQRAAATARVTRYDSEHAAVRTPMWRLAADDEADGDRRSDDEAG